MVFVAMEMTSREYALRSPALVAVFIALSVAVIVSRPLSTSKIRSALQTVG